MDYNKNQNLTKQTGTENTRPYQTVMQSVVENEIIKKGLSNTTTFLDYKDQTKIKVRIYRLKKY